MSELVIKDDYIGLFKTEKSEIDDILLIEQNDENTPFIRQWSFEQHQKAIQSDDYVHFTVKDLKTEDLLGYVILIGATNPDLSLEFKRMVITQKGEGYGRKTFRLVTKYGFEQLNMHRIWLEVMEHNKVGYNLYLSEGYKVEGTHRESCKLGDKFINLIVMSMLKAEFERFNK
jgi:RimJ/RimL family protein N-acetyltransferase